MALTATEQLQLISGTVKPTGTTLDALVHQTAFMQAKVFYDTYKVFDTTVNIDASQYLDRIFNISDNVLRSKPQIIEQLTRIVVTIIGASTATLATVQGASTAQWESFIATNMLLAFEYLAGVKKNEKQAYTAI